MCVEEPVAYEGFVQVEVAGGKNALVLCLHGKFETPGSNIAEPKLMVEGRGSRALALLNLN